jgi:16S rRNA (cytidine1402-2'-O)-methyltransferase
MQIIDIALEPALYLIATPIGNITDITIRALQTLKAADYIACEDSRVTGKLLSHYDIKKSMLIYNDHSKDYERNKIIDKIIQGKSIALVSDAGTPLISDPGYKLVKLAMQNSVKVTICPGPSSAISALAVSGLPTNNFLFEGFLSHKQNSRVKQLQELKLINKTIILFESASRLLDLLHDIKTVMGERYVSVIRELTKIYEEIKTDKINAVIDHYDRHMPRGEVVVIITADENNNLITELSDLDKQLKILLKENSVKDAVEIISHNAGFIKKDIYKRAISLIKEQ